MAEHPIVGTWAFISSEWKRADARHANPFGEGSVGVLMYDAGGYISAQIMRTDRPAVAAGTTPPTLDQAFATAVPGFLAYFGSYELDDAAGVVVHTVIASSFPPWVGTEHRRRFKIDGERLTLSDDLVTADGVAVAASTVWHRIS